MVFGAVVYLIGAAKGVSAKLDAIRDLIEQVQNYTIRLSVYEKADTSEELRTKLTEILVLVVEILAKSTRNVKDQAFRAKEYAKNVFFGTGTEMQNLLVKLDKLTQSENLLVNAETFVQTKTTGREIESMGTSLAAVQVSQSESARGIVAIQQAFAESKPQASEQKNSDQLETLKKMLNPSGLPQERFEEIKRERRLIPQSGDWLLTEEAFIDWTQGNSPPTLWISGNPGSGKSFLTYNIISHLNNHAGNDTHSASYESSVAYFFFRDNNPFTQPFLRAFCDIAHQLSQSDPAYAKYLASANNNMTGLSSVGLAWKILIKDYWLDGKAGDRAYIVLDGLDEASTACRQDLFKLLDDLEFLGKKSRLRIAMLGRPHVVEEMSLAGLREPPTIQVDSSRNGADIVIYVRSSTAKLQSMKDCRRSCKRGSSRS